MLTDSTATLITEGGGYPMVDIPLTKKLYETGGSSCDSVNTRLESSPKLKGGDGASEPLDTWNL
jgi:hypothetical protein